MDIAQISDNAKIEYIGPDYQQAFGHLAYLVGRIAETNDAELKASLTAQAQQLIDRVYCPMFRLSEPTDASMAKLFRGVRFGPPFAINQSTPPQPHSGQTE
jgi:hypothetical protein